MCQLPSWLIFDVGRNMSTPDRIIEAWKDAAVDLGITFITPFALDDDGRRISYLGLLPEFGSENGMLIFVSDASAVELWASTAKKKGFGYSYLSDSYGAYDRRLFSETLDDWGWSPKDRPPPIWYSGAPWTS